MSLGTGKGEGPGFLYLKAYTILGALFKKYKIMNTKLDRKINIY